MIGVAQPESSGELLVPSVMHMRQNHYMALLDLEDGLIRAYDPMWGERHFRPEVLQVEASGHFLVAAKTELPAGWRRLSPEEMRTTLGRCGPSGNWFGGFLDLLGNLFCLDDCFAGPSGRGGGGGAAPPPTDGPPAILDDELQPGCAAQ